MANNNPNNKVEPYSFGTTVGIIIVLSLLDTVGCIVSIVGAYIFKKKGHQGLAVALAVINVISPDALPVVDEIFGIITIIIPYFQSRSEGKSVGESIQASIDSSRNYNHSKNEALRKSEKVVNKINGSGNQKINYNYDDYDDDYYDES